MRFERRLHAVALLGALLLVATSCGQRPGVFKKGLAANLPENTRIDEATGNIIDETTGQVIGNVSDFGGDGTGGSTTTTTGGDNPDGGTGPGSGNPTAPGPGEGPGGPSGGGGPGDSTGVSSDLIKIGGHAPVTGAAPVPASSFKRGESLYWNYLRNSGGSINGRQVEADIRNDNFNPSTAVAQCKELVQEKEVFLLMGIAGADQITACARYAADVGVPYISAGASEALVATLPNYFAVWMTYKQQAPLLVDYMVSKLGAKGESNGMLRFNTPGFTDGHDAFVSAMRGAGAKMDYDRAVPKTAGENEASQIATELCTRTVPLDNLHVLTSPTFWIFLANRVKSSGCGPPQLTYVGVGLTMTIDTVASAACANNSSIEGSKFLSPFPAYANADQYDPTFKKAGGTDDIQFGLWGISKLVGELMKRAGKNLTRQGFIASTEKAQGVRTNVLPDLSFSPGDHLGGSAMHMNRANCQTRRWETEKAFAKSF